MKKSLRGGAAAVLATACALFAAGCSPADVLSALQPAAGVRQAIDVAYGEGPRRRLDVYAPEGADGNAPVVVFLYGGSWESGDKAMYGFVGKALASRGLVAIIPDYRVYPEVKYPEFLQDNAAAVRWAVDRASDYGGDPRKLVLMGHSAGAYNAAMLTLDTWWLGEVGLQPGGDVTAMVGLAGPYDFLPLTSQTLKVIFAPAGDLEDTQPVNHVPRQPPPMFLAAARGDETVLPRNTERLAAAVRDQGGSVIERYYDGLSHALVIGVFGDPVSALAPVRSDVIEFINEQTQQ